MPSVTEQALLHSYFCIFLNWFLENLLGTPFQTKHKSENVTMRARMYIMLLLSWQTTRIYPAEIRESHQKA